MLLDFDPDVCAKFHTLKSKSSKNDLSDSQFLMFLLDHFEAHQSDDSWISDQCDSKVEPSIVKTEDLNFPKMCPECNFCTASSELLNDHFEEAHLEVGNFSCTCGNSYAKLPDFLRHYVDCPVAATDLQDTDSQVPRKRRKRSQSDLDTSSCVSKIQSVDMCDTSPEVYHSYRHPSVSPIPGPSKDKPFGCPKCLKGFKSKSLLDQHMHLHYPPRYKCRWCGNVYRWPPVYYHHKQKCKKRPLHVFSLNGTQDSTFGASPSRFNETCISKEQLSQAQKTFAQFMQLHAMPLPLPLSFDVQPPSSIFSDVLPPCSMTCICTEVFPNFQSYIEHTKNCQSILSASSISEKVIPHAMFPLALNADPPRSSVPDSIDPEPQLADIVSSKEAPICQSPINNGIFTCSICSKDFTSKLSLKQHVDGKHRAEGKYLCPTCGKRYRWGASFYYHKKTCVVAAVERVMTEQPSELLASHT
ncbi:hypothetical protein EG68_06591 [Paragonimus skrjabini miyazakii]|uniref:C2H2-type domain-containing protein n=1 Tax=Paragonimus skrjabini miyazakii TaxID=59628 RepID=A0A8S9YNN8_9TREM|nr:hypothetical protein EG68_06591 [Paragonimus skrjabini miyazakii]